LDTLTVVLFVVVFKLSDRVLKLSVVMLKLLVVMFKDYLLFVFTTFITVVIVCCVPSLIYVDTLNVLELMCILFACVVSTLPDVFSIT